MRYRGELVTGSQRNMPAPMVGSPAPPFTCKSHTGATISLEDLKGQKVMLWFYPRASTGG